ncbi:MAG: S8 family serine peptidase [Elainellaceae cyanobacterium]
MLNNATSNEFDLFDNNLGYTSITDIKLGESLNQVFQRHDTLLSSKDDEIINDSLAAAIALTTAGLGQPDDTLTQPSPLIDALTPSTHSPIHPSTGITGDALTGLAPGQAWVGGAEGAIAVFQQDHLNGMGTMGGLTGQTLSTNTTSGQWYIVEGSLEADWFTADYRYAYNVFSGNGNVYFGDGYLDTLDLRNLQYSQVVNYTLTPVNTGDGARMLDTVQLSNGGYIFFEGIDRVMFADRTLNLSVTPNDPYFNQQWNLHMMGVHNAWRFTQGTDDVLVGVQDTGLGVDAFAGFHWDLDADETFSYSNNIGDDFFRNVPGDRFGPRDNSHGTAVQGIIAAESNNSVGISGINWESDVFAIDVLGANAGDQTLAEATANMIDFARSRGQRLVINMSLGGGGLDPALEQLVASSQQDTLFIISAGNENLGRLSNPASLASRYSNVVAVGASWGTETETGVPVSPGTRISYNGGWGSNYGYGLSLMGPSEVLTTDATPNGFTFDSKFSGTSAAAPNVAGVASLVWSTNRNLSATSVKNILMETAYDLGAQGYDTVYGSGFVNADAAVRRAMALA